MTIEAGVRTGQVDDVARLGRVRRMLLLSLGCGVAASVLAAGTGRNDVGGGVLLTALLLWLVYRRHSRIARGIAFIPTATWAVAFAIGAWGEPDLHAGLLTALSAALFAGQAIPLVTPAVRDHVQLHRPVPRGERLAFERGRFDAPPDERDHHRRI